MKKKFLTNLILLVVLNLLIKPFWFFGIEVSVQNRVGDEMYGFYFSLFNFAFILNILLDLGINNYNNRAISRKHEILNDHLSMIIPLKFMLSFVYAIVVLVAGKLVGYSNVQFKLLLILILNQFLASFILYLRTNISGLQFYRTDSLLSVLDRSLMIIFNSILLWTGISKQSYQIEWFVYSQTLSYSLTLLVVLLVVLRHSGKISLRFKFNDFKTIISKSYPFAILILLMSFFNRADSVMIERLLEDGKEQAGIYAQSFRVMDALTQFAVLFAGLLLPMFSRMLKTEEKVDDLLKMAASIMLSVSLAVAVLAIFFNEEIIYLMRRELKDNSPQVFSILMIGFVFISTSYIYGTLLTANRSLRQLNTLAAFTVLLNIGLNLLLIPKYKALGAAIASMTSQGFYAISQVIVAYRIINISSSRFYLRLFIYGILVFVIAYLLNIYLKWELAVLIFILLSLVAAISTGLIKPKEFLMALTESRTSRE